MKTGCPRFMKLISACLLLSVCIAATCRSGPTHLTVLHVNDMHAQMEPRVSGGLLQLEPMIRSLKNDRTLILDAGDSQTGTLLSILSWHGALGGGIIEMMNRIGFDASVLGNHDFDQGLENTRRLMAMAGFPVLSANLFINDSLFAESYTIVQRNGLRIGIVGLTTDQLPSLVSRKSIEGIAVQPVIETARRIITLIDSRTDLIILLTHQGFREDSLLALSVRGADLIVGGHSHTVCYQPVKVNGTLIVQAGSSVRFLGKLDLQVQQDKITSYTYQLLPVKPDPVQPDSEFTMLADSLRTLIDKAWNEPVGMLSTPWVMEMHRESNLGNYIADVLRDITAADFAVINSGAIRKNLSAGPVLRRDIFEMLPFSNVIVTFRVTGAQLLELAETNARAMAVQKEGILQISGLHYRFSRSQDNSIVLSYLKIQGVPVDPEKTYTGASVDFVIMDHPVMYLGLIPSDRLLTGYLLPDAVIEAVSREANVSSLIEGRIVQN